jgi:type IV pilus assembly protein PilY1
MSHDRSLIAATATATRERSWRHAGRRVLAATLIASMTLPPAQVAQAASIPVADEFADVPMYLAGRPKPNLIMALDNSGSMDWEVSMAGITDGVVWYHLADGRMYGRGEADVNEFDATGPRGPINLNPDSNNYETYQRYGYLFPNGTWGGRVEDRMRRTYDSGSTSAVPPTREFGWVRSASYNGLYYNPQVRYLPWGPSNDGSTTALNGNVDPANAPFHPRFTGATVDLTQPIDSGLDEHTFRVFPGMVLPAGASYRACHTRGGAATCYGAWSAPVPSDACVVRTTGGLLDEWGLVQPAVSGCTHTSSPYSSAPDTLDLSPMAAPAGAAASYIEARIPYFPATYYSREVGLTAATAHARGPDGALLRRVEIRPATVSYPKGINRTDCAGSACTYAEEIQNFANWFTYYRKRQLMMNAAISQAFDGVTSLRVGAFLFNGMADVAMYDVDAPSDTNNLRRILGVFYDIKSEGGTPTRWALNYMGQQFMRTDTGAPVTASCQYNAGFLVTDGFANAGGPTTFGNVDGQAVSESQPFVVRYAPGGGPADSSPFADTDENTLADIAMWYYSNNLRADLPAGRVPVNMADTSPGADRNPNLHMNTYALGINLRGTIFGVNAGLTADPFSAPFTWPAARTDLGQRRESIDELWHATINGRGRMFSASSPEQTRNALLDVIDDVTSRDAAGSAVAVSSAIPVAGNNSIYLSRFRSGTWSGDVARYPVNVASGAIDMSYTASLWSATPGVQLANRDPNSRVIITHDGTNAVPFRWASLGSPLQTALSPSYLNAGNTGADLVSFLRGDRSKEGTQFRSRGPRPPYVGAVPENIAVLADIVNAEPVLVGGPNQRWSDPGYAAFRIAQASRPEMIYQGANGGMLHAFDATSGAERWAYVPGHLYRTPLAASTALSSWPYVSALAGLGQRTGFTHRYYVDGTPMVGDVDLACAGTPCDPAASSTNWKTLLVGGLRKGGFGYYALDVTNPVQATEAAAATNLARWEFPNASTSATVRANVGFSYNRPVLAKTAAAGWVALVTSGYANGNGPGESGGDGKGYLFVLNAATGALIRAISTGEGASASPSGLGPITAWADNASYDPLISNVYGGDLKGNVFRFDLSHATDVNQWSVTRIARLEDAAGREQAITAEPELALVGSQKYVYVGTGRYLGRSDIPGLAGAASHAVIRHSMYGLVDNGSNTTIRRSTSGMLGVNTATRSGSGASSAVTIATGTIGSRGWVLDLPVEGERIDGNAQNVLGALTFTSNVPAGGDPCAPQGSSHFWQIDFRTGAQIAGSSYVSQWIGDALGSRPSTVQVQQGYLAYITRTDGERVAMAVQPPSSPTPGKRKSWRELTAGN